jgi:hypothetical protein
MLAKKVADLTFVGGWCDFTRRLSCSADREGVCAAVSRKGPNLAMGMGGTQKIFRARLNNPCLPDNHRAIHHPSSTLRHPAFAL